MEEYADGKMLHTPVTKVKRRFWEIGDFPAYIPERFEYLDGSDLQYISDIFKEKFQGRIGSFFESEANINEDKWSIPPTVLSGANLNSLESSPFNHAIQVRNSKDGTTVDKLYLGLRCPIKHGIMRFDAKLPNPSTLPSDAFLGFGLEPVGSLYASIAILNLGQNKSVLDWIYPTTGGVKHVYSPSNITLSWGNWRRYILLRYGSVLQLFEDDGASPPTWTLKDTLEVNADIVSSPMMIPCFFNEGATTVVSTYFVGQMHAYEYWEEELPPRAPTIYNVTMTNANTEYSQALPAWCKKFEIHTRDESAFRLAFVTGKVATPTEPYYSIPTGKSYYDDNIKARALTLYFASANTGKVAEIIAWR